MIALRNQPTPNTSNNPPTKRRRYEIGIAEIAGPRTTTITVSVITAVAPPISADRHPRVVPAANRIVSASTASTMHARNTATNRATLTTFDHPFAIAQPPGVMLGRSQPVAGNDHDVRKPT